MTDTTTTDDELPALVYRPATWTWPEEYVCSVRAAECDGCCPTGATSLAFWQAFKFRCPDCKTKHRQPRRRTSLPPDVDGDGNLYETGNREGSVDEWDDRQGRWIDRG